VPSAPLTRKEEAFCIAVLAEQNLSDAYRAAYKPQRAKAKTIHEMASRLMAKPKVRARIEMLMQPVIERAQFSREEWLEALVRIIRADIRKMFDSAGNPLPITDLGANEAAAIEAFDVYSGANGSSSERHGCDSVLKVQMVDQLQALELYGKAMGYFAETGELAAIVTATTLRVQFIAPPDTP
jgi:hypothetical protein